MTLKPEDEHWHSGLAWDGKRIKARDLDWTWYTASSGSKFFAFDVWAQSGGVADTMFRDFLLPWKDGDMQAVFTDKIILSWQTTTMSGKISIRDASEWRWDGQFLTIKPWEIIEVQTAIYSSGGNLTIATTWGSYRRLYWNSTNLTQSWSVTMFNASTTDMKVSFRYATSSSDRPIIGVLAKIY